MPRAWARHARSNFDRIVGRELRIQHRVATDSEVKKMLKVKWCETDDADRKTFFFRDEDDDEEPETSSDS